MKRKRAAVPSGPSQETLREAHVWTKVEPVRPWRPAEGEDLIGYYLGYRFREGRFGPYGVVSVLVPKQGLYTIIGSSLVALVENALLERGSLVRIVYLGMETYATDADGSEKRTHRFELHCPQDPPEIPSAVQRRVRGVVAP